LGSSRLEAGHPVRTDDTHKDSSEAMLWELRRIGTHMVDTAIGGYYAQRDDIKEETDKQPSRWTAKCAHTRVRASYMCHAR